MPNASELKCTILKKVCVDASVHAEFPIHWWEYAKWENGKRIEGTMEDLGKVLESKCEEFMQFLRDHRSQDIVQLYVERKYVDQCSRCHNEWEPDKDEELNDGTIYCASCGAVLEKEIGENKC